LSVPTCKNRVSRERPLLAQSSRSLRQCMNALGAPIPPLRRRDRRRALSRKPGNRLIPCDPTNDRTQKTGPMCISRRILEPCAHWGRSDRRRVFGQRHLAHQRWWSRYCGCFGLRKTARLLLHLLGLLGDVLSRLGSFLCFFRFLCHVFLVRLVGLTNVRTLRTSARAIKLTRSQQKLYYAR
jgi:hypothetical protein